MKDLKQVLKPFAFHGVDWLSEEGDQAKVTCPFCGKSGHFYANSKNGLWDCKRCGHSGNIPQFLEFILEYHAEQTTVGLYKLLARKRKRKVPYTQYKKHEFAMTPGGEWLFPVRSKTGTIEDLRMWNGKNIIGTAGCKSGLWGADRLAKSKPNQTVWIAEGEWDAIALDWMFTKLKMNKEVVVVGVPGANVFKKEWVVKFQGRKVVVAYDADHPGDVGSNKVAKLLSNSARKIKFVSWSLDEETGKDVSDIIEETKTLDDSYLWLLNHLDDSPRVLLEKEKPKPTSSSGSNSKPKTNSRKSTKSRLKKASSKRIIPFSEIVELYKRWFKMTPDSVMALRIIFSTVFSVQVSGDPLWMYIVSPPGGGKTALLNPLRHCENTVFQSSLTAHTLVSGFAGSEDPSLLPQLQGKTLVLKDMTEVLGKPQHVQDEIFGQLRGAYDGGVERTYGNLQRRVYNDLNFSLVAGVTPMIHGHSKAHMGERMLKFQLNYKSKSEQRDLMRQAMANVGRERLADDELGDQTSQFLDREINVDKLIGNVPEWVINRILPISMLVAKLRSEVSRDFRGDQVIYRPTEEIATRLSKQFLKMTLLLPLTGNGSSVTKTDFKLIEKLAFDTSIGWNLDVVAAIAELESAGKVVTRKTLVQTAKLPPANVKRRIEDMELSKVIVKEERKTSKVTDTRFTYKLTEEVRELWNQARISTKSHQFHRSKNLRRRS